MKGSHEKTKDPVCGMEIEKKNEVTKSVHNGKSFYFCSFECKDTFEKDPGKYMTHKAA